MAGTVKAFHLPLDYVLYDLSYANLMLYGASLPSYKSPKEDSKTAAKEKVLNGDDPKQQAEINKLFDETNRH